MRKLIVNATLCVAVMGVAVAQMQVGSGVLLLDVDPARNGGPVGQRLSLQVNDQPRVVALGDTDEICVQLQRVAADNNSISAHVRALRPEPQAAVVVKVAGPDISPGTYRSTPWGMLLRVVSDVDRKTENVKTTTDAPVCTL